ncbi:uncharacterized protein N7511_005225 [Penicillium nucicola]|uniref:uncharacterized protein n=1 Tax=Penicillium nucicola TaxID=1850975 RepID=UPI002544F428|nr:uncharacterized protein N7511_005225 [Penicillium nucicola]KAJ5761843.1 hypothetical protein N7511_005225 [Penicillium nucicola]
MSLLATETSTGEPPTLASENTDVHIVEKEAVQNERLTFTLNEEQTEIGKYKAPAAAENPYSEASSEEKDTENSDDDEVVEASKHFRSRAGITYVSDKLWKKYENLAVNSHIYVGTTDNSGATDQMAGSPSNYAGDSAIEKKVTLPARICLMNYKLRNEMSRVCGIEDLNLYHVAPFRAIVPFEQQFRARLKELEKEFLEKADLHPDKPAITRSRVWLPYVFSVGTDLSSDADGSIIPGKIRDIFDDLDEFRAILDGFRALIYLFDNDLAHVVRTYHQARQGTLTTIPFSHLWYIFWPGQEIVSHQNYRQVYRVLQVCGGRRSLDPKSRTSHTAGSNLVISCFHLDYDGIEVGPLRVIFHIRPYVGELSVSALDVFPLEYLGQSATLNITLRGRNFVEIAQVSHRHYKGLNLRTDKFHKLEEKVVLQSIEDDPDETRENEYQYDNVDYEQAEYLKFIQETSLLEFRFPEELKEDHLILLPARVYGYVFFSRKWYPLNVELLTEVQSIKEGEYDAFDDLVLPKRHRNIIRALVKTHARAKPASKAGLAKASTQREFDIVRGKGKGLIILLHGAPGVGKTSTAECVAAHTGRPLFPITCGDIGGNTAQEVEKNLERFFELAMAWGCVLLLDEADVFLGERIRGNIHQNSLVSVFLRVLEYYSGILILTTNRVGQFDEAATSRIHCALYYPPFNQEKALQVWQKNVERLERANETSGVSIILDKKKIMKFAKLQWKAGTRWNGRQIKNAFQTAVVLADWDSLKKPEEEPSATRLRIKHFKAVVKTSNHFESYLTSVRKSDQERARTYMLRRDDVNQSFVDPDSLEQISKKAARPKWPGAEDSDDSADSDDDLVSEEDESESSDSESDSEPSKKKATKKSKKNQKKKDKEKEKKTKKKSKKAPESSESSSSSDSESDKS